MTLGLLVGRFGDVVREQTPLAQADLLSDEPFPSQLSHLRTAFAHHLIPLALLSRADGDYSEIEQEAILAHCLTLAAKAGMPIEDGERAALRAYIAEFRPTFAQLDPALKRIEDEPVRHFAELLAAAKAVVDADGVRRPGEVKLLAEIEDERKAL
jgi:hypothetical protein